MAIFFAVVGLEISREATTGDLRDKRTVAVPALGALGGLLVPVLIYLAFNGGTDAAHGWGVVMSTDTAFLVGILALFGPKCPDRLRLFLLTLAIVDDIGAITVMSIFYTSEVDMARARRSPAAIVVGIVVLRWLNVWQLAPYVVAGHRPVVRRAGVGRARDAGRRDRRPAGPRPARGPARRSRRSPGTAAS